MCEECVPKTASRNCFCGCVPMKGKLEVKERADMEAEKARTDARISKPVNQG